MKTMQQRFVLATIVGVFLWFFAAVLFQNRTFGFRDSANFYYPLFEWQTREWGAGRIPLWNPLDDTGAAVFAETTSSVLYPGKLIFALPASFRCRYHLYVTLHVLLAAAMAYRLARRWQASVPGAGLAALVYGFGGGVVFQYCNVVFLVGAAWLPAALLATDWMLMHRSLRGAVALGGVLALMTLGGDPQAAYHAGLMSALYVLLMRRSYARRQDGEAAAGSDVQAGEDIVPLSSPDGCHYARRDGYVAWHRHPLALLSCAACSGFLLAAVQILPAMEAAKRSERAVFDGPRSLPEAATAAWRQETSNGGMLGPIFHDPPPGTHLRHVYDFSFGPWHVAEFLWPNCFGKPFPRNERWINHLPAEGRAWTPSAYLGLLPLLLAALTLSGWRSDKRIRFLALLAGLSLLGSFGWYGLGWVLHELRAGVSGGEAGEPWIGNPVGGLYWLLVVFLPGYVMFRYPAKLLVVTTLAVSLLAARGWDRFVQEDSSRLVRALLVAAGLSLAMAAGFGLLQPAWTSWLADAPPDAIFGPIETKAATSGVLAALAHAAVVGLLLVIVLRREPKPGRGYVVLAVTAIELCVANGWMTMSLDADVWRAESAVSASADGSAPPPRLYRDANSMRLPAEWLQQTADDRLDEIVRWERTTLLPRHQLNQNVAVIGSHTTLRSLDTAALLRVKQQYSRETRDAYPDALLAPLSVSRLLTGADIAPAGCAKLDVSPAEGVAWWEEPRVYPRVWLASEAVVMQPLREGSRRMTEERTREVFLDNGRPRDLRAVVFLEADAGLRLPTRLPALTGADGSQLVEYDPQRVVVAVQTGHDVWLVLNDTFYPGWQATRETSGQRFPLTIYRANRLMRAVLLPPGEHRVEFVYRPTRFWIGALISGIAWLGLGAISFNQLRCR